MGWVLAGPTPDGSGAKDEDDSVGGGACCWYKDGPGCAGVPPVKGTVSEENLLVSEEEEA